MTVGWAPPSCKQDLNKVALVDLITDSPGNLRAIHSRTGNRRWNFKPARFNAKVCQFEWSVSGSFIVVLG